MEALPSALASPRGPFASRAAWIAVLALSPLAYLGSFYLAKSLPSQNSPFTLGRDRAIQIALDFARSHHIDAQGWAVTIGTQKDDEMSEVLAHVRPPALEQVASSSPVTVRFRAPSSEEWIRVVLTPAGRVTGFSINEPGGDMPLTSDAEAEQAATSFLRDFLGTSSSFQLGAPKMRMVNKARQDRMFEWGATVPGFSEGQAAFRVEVAGDHVIMEACDVKVNYAYLRLLQPGLTVYYCLLALGGLYMAAMGVYAIVRFVRRAFNKEVSYRRTMLVVLVFVAVSTFSIYNGVVAGTLSVNGAPPTSTQKAVLLGIFVVAFSLFGGFFGIAYGAGEGDVRTFYPGKLTSLDTLLSGKVFSVNVARSILAGGAFAGAMLLVKNLALVAVRSARPLEDNEIVSSLIAAFPLGEVFSKTALHAVARAAFGLLLPIALLRPRVRWNGLYYALLPLCTMLSAFLSAESSQWRIFIISVLVSVTVTCTTFFRGDLLASISAVVAFDLVGRLIYRSTAVPFWADISLPVVYAGVAFLLVQIYFAERGKIYEDWEVRPLYARHLAERLSLQAEIGAARQAQLRLLPDLAPQIAGLSIAGSCFPAREVGGDFYDFFGLDDHRVGIFVAEGGNRELASAMPIALAKGYLLYSARLDLSPVEVLRRLRDVLGVTLRDVGASVPMLYAVVDARAATLRYARTGVSPRVTINGTGAVEEVAAGAGCEMPIQQGAAALAPRDAIVFYTDGLTAQIAEKRREAVGKFLTDASAQTREGPAADLHTAIFRAAICRVSQPPLDDVTTVVIRLEQPAAQVLEVVV